MFAKYREFLLVICIFTIFSFVLFWPVFLGKVNLNGNLLTSFYAPFGQNLPYKNSGWDQLRIYFPFYKITLESFKAWQVPLWSTYAFSGHPHMADFQTAVFYPLNIFGLFLGQIGFWHILRITPMILGAFFTFLYLRNLKLSSAASYFGAFAFGFSPFVLTWGEEVVMSPHSIIWLPLILFAIDKYLQTNHKKFLVLVSLATAFSLLGGYMQTSIYVGITVILYLVFRLWKKSWLNLNVARFIGALVLGTGIAALQLLPSAELFFNGARSQIRLTNTLYDFLLPIESLATYLSPDFFGSPATGNFFRRGVAQYYEGILFVGVAVLFFAAAAVFFAKKNKLVTFWGILGLVALATTLDLPTSRILLWLPVPFLSTSIANRILFIPAFCISILGAIGMNMWLSGELKKTFKLTSYFSGIFAIVVFYLLGVKFFDFSYITRLANVSAWQNAQISLRNLAIPIVVLVVLFFCLVLCAVKPRLKKYAAVLIIVVSQAHIFYFSQKYFSFSESEYIFPQVPVISYLQQNQEYWRSWGFGEAFLENNFASQYKIFWPEGYDSLNNRSYGEFTGAMQGDGDVSDYTFRADAGLGRGDGDFLLTSENRRKLVDIVGVKFVIGGSADFKLLEKNNFAKVFDAGVDNEGKNFAVFENKQVLPRAFLASNYEGPPNVDSTNKTAIQINKERRKLIVGKLLSDGFDFRNVILLEEPSPISPQFGPGEANIISYKQNEVLIWTKSDLPKLLFLTDNFYPGWKVKVDGKKSKILRADYTFRSVPLLAGEHTVKFYYDPLSFKLGLIISVVSLGLLAILTLRQSPLKD